MMSDTAKLQQLNETLEALKKRKRFRSFEFFKPYKKQRDFFLLGTTCRERLLMAGNQLGKTYCGAFEMACHLTGEYPVWWMGRRFTKPIKAWACGESSLLVRDVQQKLLCGEPGVEAAFGTGMIPKAAFADKPSMARGVTDAYDTIQITHRTNGVVDGVSICRFKSYEQGRVKFQGETLDFVWDDEEPPADIYSEQLTRTTATAGMVMVTFTPLKGMSTVVRRYIQEPSPDRGYVTMTIDDVDHITPEEKIKIIAGYPAHEREARARGVPMLGSGLIFQVSDEAIMEPRIEHLPQYWKKAWAIDFGIGHSFAAVLGIWDVDNDVVHIHHAIKVKDQMPLQHSVPMKTIGAQLPVIWPQDGTAREKSTGITVSAAYKAQGLLMCPDHATWPDGSVSTEAAVLELQDRMTTGRFKVAAHLSEWFAEKRLYHRKDGVIVKIDDDLMAATQKFIMAKRFAKPVNLGSKAKVRSREDIADGVDFDIFGS